MLVTSGRTPETYLASFVLCMTYNRSLPNPLSQGFGDVGMSAQVCEWTKSIIKLASAGKISLFEDFLKINTIFTFQETSHCILLCWFSYSQFLCNSAPNCSSRKTHLTYLHKLKLVLLVHPVFGASHHSQSCSDLRPSAGYPMWKTSASKATVTLHGNSWFFTAQIVRLNIQSKEVNRIDYYMPTDNLFTLIFIILLPGLEL